MHMDIEKDKNKDMALKIIMTNTKIRSDMRGTNLKTAFRGKPFFSNLLCTLILPIRHSSLSFLPNVGS